SLLDRFDDARHDFELARKLAPDSEIAYIAGAQEALFDGNIEEAIRISHQGISKGDHNFLLLTLFGEALLRSGIAPGQKEFEEALSTLAKINKEQAEKIRTAPGDRRAGYGEVLGSQPRH